MNIFHLELKRLLKTRRILVMLITSVALSILMAISAVQGVRYDYLDKAHNTSTITGRAAVDAHADSIGNSGALHGITAIHENQKLYKPFEGQITDQVLRDALETYESISKKYNGNVPDAIYLKEILPRTSRLMDLASIYRGSSADLSVLMGLSPEQVTDFYGKRTAYLEKALAKIYPNSPSTQQQALFLNSKIKSPFTYEYGISLNSIGSIGLMIFLVVLVCAVINGSIFSGGYQSGADAVLRTTKNGRRKLALSKLGASLATDAILFSACIAVYTLIINNAFGWRGWNTSEQTNELYSIAPITFGQKEIILIVAGFITLMAVACFTMFLSSVCPTPVSSLIMGIGFCVLPSIIWRIAQGDAGNPAALICNFFPAGGVGFGNALSFQLDKIMFLTIGPVSIWGPYLAIGAALIEIPVFFLLAVHAYCRHQAA